MIGQRLSSIGKILMMGLAVWTHYRNVMDGWKDGFAVLICVLHC